VARRAQFPVTFCTATVEAHHQPDRLLFPLDFVFHPYFFDGKISDNSEVAYICEKLKISAMKKLLNIK